MDNQIAAKVSNAENTVAAEPVSFDTEDGFPIQGDLFAGTGNGPAVLVSAATGAPRTFYNKFAAWLVENGASAALSYDYRGMPGSPQPKDWSKRINFKDWALHDYPAAADFLARQSPEKQLVGIGQSFGGQALGLSGIADRFERYAFVAVISGYWGNLNEPLKSYLMMNFVGLPTTWMLGRTASWMGLGAGVPATVFSDWARWCRMPEYFFDDPKVPETNRFADVNTPILSIGMTDDPWGTKAAVHAFAKHYSGAEITEKWVSPADTNDQEIGHLGFFRSKHRDTLWPIAGNWLLEGKLPD